LGQLVYNPANSPTSDRTWKVYGPDKSGTYGGAQGIGGLDNEVDEANSFDNVPVNNFFGDAVGETFAEIFGPGSYGYESYTYGLTLGGYGPEPDTYLNVQTPEWRGHYADYDTGFVYFGARYYEARSGRFLSADPLGNAASMDLYSYCNGDPVNGLDPDGRFGKGAIDGMDGNIASGDPNSGAFNFGFDVGNAIGSLSAGSQSFGNEMVAPVNPQTYINLYQQDQVNYNYFGNSTDAAIATLDPAYSAEAGFYEAGSGTGIQAGDSGETLSGWQRAGSAFEGVQGAVGTVGLAYGAVGLGSAGINYFGSSAAEEEGAALTPYSEGGGHHIPAKSAFTGDPAYDANEALAMSNAEMAAQGVRHSAVTGAQQTLYRAYAQTGQPLTWDAMQSIETQALVKGGMSPGAASTTVSNAINALKASGVNPTRIPWGGN
jgi:RHS repeat-associated protein